VSAFAAPGPVGVGRVFINFFVKIPCFFLKNGFFLTVLLKNFLLMPAEKV
jgi:hypothetical protein